MRIAVLFSPNAGGRSDFSEIGRVLTERLSGHRLQACDHPSQRWVPNAQPAAYPDSPDYKARIARMTQSLADAGAELLVTVGGDGLASYAAASLRRAGIDLPILGVAAGTANVGPIVTLAPERLSSLSPDRLSFHKVGAVEATVSGESALGFNDVVIGSTLLGTVDGRTACLSAEAMALRGESLEKAPMDTVAGPDFAVLKNGVPVPGDYVHPSQIVISPLWEGECYGRAVTGALCLSPSSRLKAAAALLGEPVVAPARAGMAEEHFFCCSQLLFGEGDTLSLTGLADGAHVIADGNPYLRSGGPVLLRYLPAAATVCRALGEE